MNVKSKIEEIKIILGKKRIEYLLLSLVILSVYVIMCFHNFTYIDAFLSTFYFGFFLLIYFIILLYFNTLLYNYYQNNYNYLMRISNKKNHVKNMLYTTFVLTTFIFIILLFLLMIVLNIFCKIKSPEIIVYNVPTMIYFLYTIIKFYFLQLIIVFLTQILLQKFKKNTIIITSLFFYLIIFYYSKFTEILESIKLGEFYLWIGNYFFSNQFYNSFFTDILNSTIYIIILFLSINLFKKHESNYLRDLK